MDCFLSYTGRNEANRTSQSSADTCPTVYERRTSITGGSFQPKGCWVNWNIGSGSDEREIGKVTAEVSFDEHVIKFGYEQEGLIAVDETTNSGGVYFLLMENDYIADHPRTTGGTGGIGYTAAGYTDEEIVRKRTYISGGTYKIDNSAFFAQGSFQLTDNGY